MLAIPHGFVFTIGCVIAVIGGQIVSHTIGPSREIDAISAFILGRKTISDLTTFTSACNPDISSEPSAEPITIAAEQALQKLKSA